jgi:exonuclease III
MSTRKWNVMCWNIKGVNSDKKWNAVRDRDVESYCDVICLQETKRDSFNDSFIRNMCPPAFDYYEYLPSVGLSGGVIIV